MGVPGLWEVLQDRKIGVPIDISQLQGKTLAIDISGWMSHSTRAKYVQDNPHLQSPLRNIFWRLKHLIKHQIRPLGVFDGPTPVLKKPTMEKRYGFWIGSPRSPNYDVSQCKQLFEKMGVPFLVAEGEAEATCAVLNAKGIVDGVLTDDGDAFLFGAKVVYKDFSVGTKKGEGLMSFSMRDVEEKLGVDREGLIAWGLLVGCDYTNGVDSIGKEQALKLLKQWKGQEALDRFRSWRVVLKGEMERLMSYRHLSKPSHCGICTHPGTVPKHKKDGCCECETSSGCTESTGRPCGCDYHKKLSLYEEKKVELKIREVALKDLNFPNEQIIEAFQNPLRSQPVDTFQWTQPDFNQLKNFCSNTIQFDIKRAKDQVLEYLVDFTSLEKSFGCSEPCAANPSSIKKIKTVQGTQMVIVEWESCDGIPVDNFPFTTEENKTLFHKLYPAIIDQFEKEKEEEKSRKSTGKKKVPMSNLKTRKMTEYFPQKKYSEKELSAVKRKLNFSHNNENESQAPKKSSPT